MLELEPTGRLERGVDFRLLGKSNDPGPLFCARIGKIVERAIEQSILDRAGTLEKSDDVGRFSGAQPARGQSLGCLDERNRAAPPENLPIRINHCLAGGTGHFLALQRVKQEADAFPPAAHKVDCHRIPDALDLPSRFEPQRNDEAGIG